MTAERRQHALIDALPHHSVWFARSASEWLDDRGKEIHPLDREDVERAWENAREEHRSFEVRHRLRTAGGKYRWAVTRAVPVAEGESIVEWAGTTADVHAQIVLEEGSRVLREANRLFTSTFDEALVVERLAQLVVPVLADGCAIELIGDEGTVERSLLRVADGVSSDLAELLRLIEPPDAESASYVDEIPAEMRQLGVEAIAIVPMNVRGNPMGVFRMASRDMHRYHGEEELELISEVVRRAATALDAARLYARAGSANRAKDIFLATLSHEMKTPLTAILGWAHMLKMKGPDHNFFDEALGAIEQSARVQERLIEDVLDVSRIITGKLHIEKQRTNLHDVIRAAVDIVTPAATQNGVHLRVHDSDDELPVHGDETRLRQVMWNLLMNAVKFTPEGGFVEIDAGRDGSEARVSVRDSGRGIRADVIPHLFDQFHQAMLSDRAKHNGLGLGLSIVRHLVQAHGGRVEARSEGEGKGAEFLIFLPLLGSGD